MDIVRLDAGSASVDASAGTITANGSSQTIGSQTVELSANPFLDVVAHTSAGASLTRRYPGYIFVELSDGFLHIINHVDFETYVASVMSSEISPGWPLESLHAHAIAIRTYAAHSRLSSATRDYDVNDDTTSQVYRGTGDVAPSLYGAAHDTAGLIVTEGAAPATVFYSSSCGGHTASSTELTGLPAPPYLGGVPDIDPSRRAYCANAPYFRWTNAVSADAMSRVVDVAADQLNAISVAQRWPDGRVRSVTVTSPSATTTLDGREFYSRALSVLGYKVIPSALFDVTRDGQNFNFTGHGVGHGVGMCQWGTRGRADAGMNAAQILSAYFPGTAIAHI